jgi:hypothetical protein
MSLLRLRWLHCTAAAGASQLTRTRLKWFHAGLCGVWVGIRLKSAPACGVLLYERLTPKFHPCAGGDPRHDSGVCLYYIITPDFILYFKL